MAKRIENLKLIENKRINKDFFIIELSGQGKLPEIKPGQFAQIRVDGSPETFLRRPFSIHDVDWGKNALKLLIQVAGKGTETLSKLNNGDLLNLIYPLGNSFSIPVVNEKVLLVVVPSLAIRMKAIEIARTGNPKSGYPELSDSLYHALAIVNDAIFVTNDFKHVAKVNRLGHVEKLADYQKVFERIA